MIKWIKEWLRRRKLRKTRDEFRRGYECGKHYIATNQVARLEGIIQSEIDFGNYTHFDEGAACAIADWRKAETLKHGHRNVQGIATTTRKWHHTDDFRISGTNRSPG